MSRAAGVGLPGEGGGAKCRASGLPTLVVNRLEGGGGGGGRGGGGGALVRLGCRAAQVSRTARQGGRRAVQQ